MRTEPYHLTAQPAGEALGVTTATLYAYTSRGQLRSEPIPGRPRQRRYYREDIERLRERKEARRDPAKAAARGLRWGGPVLESGITLFDNGRFYYRGQDATTLAATASLEQVAALLWAADEADRGLFTQSSSLSRRQWARPPTIATHALTRVQATLPIAAAADLASYDLRPAGVRQTGGRILRLVTNIVAQRESRVPIHLALRAGWRLKGDAAADVIRTALVLCAD